MTSLLPIVGDNPSVRFASPQSRCHLFLFERRSSTWIRNMMKSWQKSTHLSLPSRRLGDKLVTWRDPSGWRSSGINSDSTDLVRVSSRLLCFLEEVALSTDLDLLVGMVTDAEPSERLLAVSEPPFGFGSFKTSWDFDKALQNKWWKRINVS